jgi:hypothetical protein
MWNVKYYSQCSGLFHINVWERQLYTGVELNVEYNCTLFSTVYAIVLHTRLLWSARPSDNSHLIITNTYLHLTVLALWNSLPPDLRHLSSHSTSSQPNLNSLAFSLSTSVFIKNLNSSLSHFFSSLVSPAYRLPLNRYISGIDLA